MWKKILQFIMPNRIALAQINDSTSIHKLVNFNDLNKRKNIRINYPHIGGVNPYPLVKYKGTEIITINISVGGLLVIDDTNEFGTEIGDVITVDLIWPDAEVKVRAKVVGINQQKRHLQFVDFNAQAFLKISKLIKPGFLGSRFHKVTDNSGNLDAQELWVGPTGENLVFYNKNEFAKLIINKNLLTFQKKPAQITVNETAQASQQLIEDVLCLTANLPGSSLHTKHLIEFIDDLLPKITNKKTGTYG